MLGNLNITYDVELIAGLGIDDGRYVISLTTCVLIALSWTLVPLRWAGCFYFCHGRADSVPYVLLADSMISVYKNCRGQSSYQVIVVSAL